MQGNTGQYLITAADRHGITIAYADNLDHRIGEYNPAGNTITLELPLGIETATEDDFQEMVLTGRRIMYEELDHGVRYHEKAGAPDISAQDNVDGYHTSNEAIARITAYVGMSEDAQIGSAPPVSIQLGMPESGHAIYYSTTDTEMADILISGLKPGEYFHEHPELIEEAYAAFYGTSSSEWYTLYYASYYITDNFIGNYSRNVSLAQVLDDYRDGNSLSFDEFSRHTTDITDTDLALLKGLKDRFENGEFTAEAERLDLNDLIRFKRKLSQPDGGRANHLARTKVGGNFFRDAPPERLKQAFDILINDAQIIRDFMGSCIGKNYLSENARDVAKSNHTGLGTYIPALKETVGSVTALISTGELDAASRIQLERLYRQLETPLVTPSKNRVTIYENYVRGKRSDGVLLCP